MNFQLLTAKRSKWYHDVNWVKSFNWFLSRLNKVLIKISIKKEWKPIIWLLTDYIVSNYIYKINIFNISSTLQSKKVGKIQLFNYLIEQTNHFSWNQKISSFSWMPYQVDLLLLRSPLHPLKIQLFQWSKSVSQMDHLFFYYLHTATAVKMLFF